MVAHTRGASVHPRYNAGDCLRAPNCVPPRYRQWSHPPRYLCVCVCVCVCVFNFIPPPPNTHAHIRIYIHIRIIFFAINISLYKKHFQALLIQVKYVFKDFFYFIYIYILILISFIILSVISVCLHLKLYTPSHGKFSFLQF